MITRGTPEVGCVRCAMVRVVSGQIRRETAAHEGNAPEMAPRRTVAGDMPSHVRVTAPELALLDAEVERQKALAPGAPVTRTSIVRGLVRALAGAGKGGKPARKPKP